MESTTLCVNNSEVRFHFLILCIDCAKLQLFCIDIYVDQKLYSTICQLAQGVKINDGSKIKSILLL